MLQASNDASVTLKNPRPLDSGDLFAPVEEGRSDQPGNNVQHSEIAPKADRKGGRPSRRVAEAGRDDQVVSKANEAITIRPKRGKLTLLSRRIYNVFLFHAQRQGVDRDRYTILLAQLIDDARFSSHNTELLKSHIRDMQATTIEWHTSVQGARQWTSTQLLGPVVIDEPGRGRACTITWSYPEPIRERLVKPSHYTRILLEISSQMRSHAASVLYELGARYLTSPGRVTMREDVIWWASVLTGRSDIKSVDYRILHRDTIKRALAELDSLSDDFRLEVIEHRRGRKVEELQFRVVPKERRSAREAHDTKAGEADPALLERLIDLGFGRADAHNLCTSMDESPLRAALDHVEQRMQRSTLAPLKSPIAYFRDAVKKNYVGAGEGASSQNVGTTVSAVGTVERLNRLRDDWEHRQHMRARARYDDMPEAERDRYHARFETERLAEAGNSVTARAWHREGLASRLAASAFHRWLASTLWPDEVTDAQLLQFAMEQSE